MKKNFIFLVSICVWGSLFFLPLVTSAQTTLVDFGLFPCDGVTKECTFNDLVTVANGIINALFFAVMLIAPLLIARAGYYYVISGDKPAERAKANGQLKGLVIGLVIIACSYAIVKLVLSVLIKQTNLSVEF